ncbi:MAG: hypothetical protein RMK94_06935 [Armatimonadota bacterium]|nr:hypothetical protein [Armatimonadota bacterium]
MKRRDLIRQVGTLAVFSLTPLAVVEAVQLPAEDERRPLGKPRYVNQVNVLQACKTGAFICNVGVDGICSTGTITCSTGVC